MAYVCDITDVNPEMYDIIMKSLTLKPVSPEEQQRKKWGFKGVTKIGSSQTVESIVMFQFDGRKLRLPYRFACAIFNKICNTDLHHLKIINDYNPPFVGNLRENQIEPSTTSLHYLLNTGTTTVGLPPGFGKTVIGSWLTYMLGYMFVVIVPREPLIRQWMKTFSDCIPGIISNIWMPGINDPPISGIPAGIITLDTRVKNIPDEYKKYVGTLIVDEAHMLCTRSRVEALLSFTPRYTIIETATLEREDEMHSMIHVIAGEHGVFKTSIKPYKVISINTQIMHKEVFTSRGCNYTSLCKSISEDVATNMIVVDIIKTNPHRKYIILTRLAEHTAELSKLLIMYGITSDTMMRTKKSYSDTMALVGTMPKIGVGLDEENSCADFKGIKSNVIILFHSVKQEKAFEQFRGRVMRVDEPIVIWLNPKNKTCRSHLSGLKPWIRETNGTLVEIEYVEGKLKLP